VVPGHTRNIHSTILLCYHQTPNPSNLPLTPRKERIQKHNNVIRRKLPIRER